MEPIAEAALGEARPDVRRFGSVSDDQHVRARIDRREFRERVGEEREILLRRESADVAHHDRLCRNPTRAAEGRSVAGGEGREIDAGRDYLDARVNAAFPEDRRHRLARRNHGVAQIRIARGQLDREALHPGRIERHVARVVLVQGVVGEHDRQIEFRRDPQRGITEQERMVRVHEIRPEALDRAVERPGDRQGDREVASAEVLDRGDANDSRLATRCALEPGRPDQDALRRGSGATRRTSPRSARHPRHGEGRCSSSSGCSRPAPATAVRASDVPSRRARDRCGTARTLHRRANAPRAPERR